MTTSEEFQFTAMEAERLREQVRRLEAENKRLCEAMAGIIAYDDVALTDERAADYAVRAARAALEGGQHDSL